MGYLKLFGRGFGYVALALTYGALLLNTSRCFPGYVASRNPRVEALAILFLLLPWLLLPVANLRLLFKGPRSRKRLWTAALLFPVSLATAFVAAVMIYADFYDIQYRLVNDKEDKEHILSELPRPLPGAISAGNHQIRAYVSPGFLSADAVVIQREQPLAFGLFWVTPLYNQYGAQTVKMAVQNNQVRCVFPYSNHPTVMLPLR